MRVLITGSRDWSDFYTVQHAYDWIREQITHDPYDLPSRWEAGQVTIVSGHCPSGADFVCERVAFDYGFKVEQHPAKWRAYGRQAGFIRNQEMVDLGADVCFAFGSTCRLHPKTEPHITHGTDHCYSAAAKAGIPTRLYWQEPFKELPTVIERNWK